MTVTSYQPDETTGVDTMIYELQVSFNYGLNAQIWVGKVQTFEKLTRGLIYYPLTGITPGSIVSSAILTVKVEGETGTVDVTLAAHRSLVQWYEGNQNGGGLPGGVDGSTWSHRNANGNVDWAGGHVSVAGSDFATDPTATVTVTGVGSYDLDVTADVAAFVAGTATNYGWFLKLTDEATLNTRKTLTSSSGATEADRPKLVVTWTAPAAPATGPGGLSGLSGMCCASERIPL